MLGGGRFLEKCVHLPDEELTPGIEAETKGSARQLFGQAVDAYRYQQEKNNHMTFGISCSKSMLQKSDLYAPASTARH